MPDEQPSREDERGRHCRPLRPVDDDAAQCSRPRRWWRSSGFVSVRDVILFGSGLGVIGYQVIVADTIDPTVLLVGAAMAGLPLIFENRTPKGP